MLSVLRRVATNLLIVAACTLSGCGGLIPGGKPGSGSATRDHKSAAAVRICLGSLRQNAIAFNSLPNRDFGGGCGTFGTVQMTDFGVPTSNLGAMTCPLANEFATWVRFVVRPASRQHFGRELARIDTMGTYSCRRVSGNGRLSEHARANAVDVSGFVLEGGRRVSVLNGWNGDENERAFFRAIHNAACRRFGTVLGPDYNAQHADHLHLDMASSRFCR